MDGTEWCPYVSYKFNITPPHNSSSDMVNYDFHNKDKCEAGANSLDYYFIRGNIFVERQYKCCPEEMTRLRRRSSVGDSACIFQIWAYGMNYALISQESSRNTCRNASIYFNKYSF